MADEDVAAAPHRIAELLNAFLAAELPEMREMVGRHKELLHLEAERLLRDHASQLRDAGKGEDAEALEWHADLLAECRERGIECAFAALAQTTDTHKATMSVGAALNELAALVQSQDRSFDSRRLRREVALCRGILSVLPRQDDPLRWADVQGALGNALVQLGERDGGTTRLEEALTAYRAALEEMTCRRAPLLWAATQHNLGAAFFALGERESGTARLEAAVAAYHAALTERTRERVPLDWATTQNNLGNALARLGERDGRTARLEQAVVAYHAALEERTRTCVPLEWAITQNNLGNVLKMLGEREPGTARLKEAVAAFSAALDERARETVPLDWAMTQNNLGTALVALGEREAGTAKLEDAVVAFRAALEETTRERMPLAWATTQNNLGNALATLGERESGTARLEESVVAYRAALTEWTRDRAPLDWAMTQNNLGNALRVLGQREEGTASFAKAVAAHRAALTEWTRDRAPLDWAMTQNNLGNALRALGERENGIAWLEEAIGAFRAALSELAQDRVPLAWATTQNNLGNALQTLGELENSTVRLEQAATAYRAALTERTREFVPLDWARTQNNLATALAAIGEREAGIAHAEQAVTAYCAALEVLSDSSDLESAQMVRSSYARLLVVLGRHADAVSVLEAAIRRSEADLLEPGWSESDRLRSVARTEALFGLLALCHLRKPAPDPAAALAAAEAGRARLLADSLALDRVRLEDIDDPEVRAAIVAARDHRDRLRLDLGYAPRGDQPPPALRPAEREAMLTELRRAQDAYEALCRHHKLILTPEPLSGEQIRLAVPPGGALVLPVLTEGEAFALVVAADQAWPAVVELPGLDLPQVVGLLSGEDGWLGCYHAHFSYLAEHGEEDPAAAARWRQKLTATQAWLWQHVMAPVHRHLRGVAELGREEVEPGRDEAKPERDPPVVLLPPGLLGLLPLHAAGPGPEGRFFDDHWTVSYAPSVRSLLACHVRRGNPGGRPLRLLGVLDPDGSLPGARGEGALLRRRFGAAAVAPEILVGAEASLTRVLAALRGGATVLHASTHGKHVQLEPARSNLTLAAGGALDVATLRQQEQAALRLAFLAACETGLAGVHRLPEEFIGLPTGFVQAGAAAVIGSLWPVGDIAGFVLADRFYELFVGPDGCERMAPAEALRDAQRWLRRVTYGELRRRYPLAPGSDGAELLLRLTPVGVRRDHPPPRLTLGADGDRPFEEATHWAAFACTGA